MISVLSNLITELSLLTTWHVTQHVAHDKCSMCCTWFAHDCTGPLERTCWRWFVVQWGGCRKSQIAPLNAIVIIIIFISVWKKRSYSKWPGKIHRQEKYWFWHRNKRTRMVWWMSQFWPFSYLQSKEGVNPLHSIFLKVKWLGRPIWFLFCFEEGSGGVRN